jgi:hypothetical protein
VPKKKQKRKPMSAAYVAQTESTKSALKTKIIRWASISVILAILLSLMIAAISASPSQAASATPAASCAPIDTDSDGILNTVDSDIDGDGIVNGLDPDIDGDKILNTKDGDPAATNCGVNAPPPISFKHDSEEQNEGVIRVVAIVVVVGLGVGYIVLRRVRRSKK